MDSNALHSLVRQNLHNAHAGRAEGLGRGLASSSAKDTNAAARDFEAVFISQMLRPMFETLEVNQTFGGGRAEEVWRDLMVEEYGKTIAARGGFGIADSVKKIMLKQQEIVSTEPVTEPKEVLP